MAQEKRALRQTGRAVRLTIPAKVAYNLDSFQESIADLVDKLGCRACFSGADCTFQLERDFVVNEALQLGSVRTHPADIQLPLSSASSLSAAMPTAVSYNIDQVQKAVAEIAGRLGCPACCSGFDITFRNQLDFLIDKDLGVTQGY
jgi:hypothetical protein